jgi:nitrogen fixation/metabolism regulation signal transduction histidine kinase
VRAVALIPSSTFVLGAQERYLVVTQALSPTLAGNALAVTNAYREYQQRALARSGLRKMYIGTLTLTLVLAVFGALLLAIALSNQLAQPLLLLPRAWTRWRTATSARRRSSPRATSSAA